MAKNKSSEKKEKKSSSVKITLSKVAFWSMVVVALMYLIGMILSFTNISLKIVSALQGVGMALMLIVTSIVAWKHIKPKSIVYKILYVLVFLVIIVGIIIPLI